MRVLLVDDDADLLDVTAYALRREGFDIIQAIDGAQAVRRWEADQPNVVVLDVGLPHQSGFEVCRTIRERSQVPVILLTARHDEDSVVKGFLMGADDYVTKPFSPRQLSMRIRAVARRAAGSTNHEPRRELRVADLVLDVEAHEVRRGARVIALTPLEFRLLRALATNAGQVVSSKRLVDYAWSYDSGDTYLLKTHICHIRKKLGLPREGPGAIRGIPGVGYRLVVEQRGST